MLVMVLEVLVRVLCRVYLVLLWMIFCDFMFCLLLRLVFFISMVV